MRNLIAVFMLILSVGAFADEYVFTEEELEEYTRTIIENAYDKKDLEIADIIQSYDLIILEKDKDLVLKDAEIYSLTAINQSLRADLKKQETYIKWSPAIIVTGVTAGLVGGFLLGSR